MDLLSTCFLLGFLSVLAQGEECPALFRRYSDHHTYCLPKNQSCTILQKYLTEGDPKTIVDAHNQYRSRIATGQETIGDMPQASNMMQMVWDDELSAVAQKHAEQCLFKHDCDDCRRVQNFGVGQNLYTYWISTSAGEPPVDWKAAVKGWYDEVQYFKKKDITPFKSGENYGHFTQVVWATSWRVGCGYALYNAGDDYQQLYTCNYGPAGNMKRGVMYEQDQTCSACPTNACCDDSCGGDVDYPGLCKMKNPNEEPAFPVTGDYYLYCDFKDQPDCGISKAEGVNKWKIFKSLSGNYLSIILNGGEKSTLEFAKSATGSDKLCFIVKYRKGANVDGQEVANTAKLNFIMPSSTDNNFSKDLKDDSEKFIQFSMSLGWGMETRISVSFSVPSGKPAQYFEVGLVAAKEGPCSKK